MTAKSKKAPARKSPQAPTLSSETLAAQTEAFLKEGGKIDYVKQGVSGQVYLPGRKHITLDSKPKA